MVIFDKNEGNFREKKIFQKNVKFQFVNGGLHPDTRLGEVS